MGYLNSMDPARDITVIERKPIDYLGFSNPEDGRGSRIVALCERISLYSVCTTVLVDGVVTPIFARYPR